MKHIDNIGKLDSAVEDRYIQITHHRLRIAEKNLILFSISNTDRIH